MRYAAILFLLAGALALVAGCGNKQKKEDPKPTHEEIVASEKERCEVFCRGECERLKAFGGPAEGTESDMIAATDQMADADQLKRLCACKCETEQVAPDAGGGEGGGEAEGGGETPAE